MNNPDSRPFSVSFSGWFLKPALIGLLLLLNTGCAGLYFRPAQQLPLEIPRYTLDRWPYAEYWTGIVFNGNKIGFSHFQLSSSDDSSEYKVACEMALAFNFLLTSKKVALRSEDVISHDLSLHRFVYEYFMDGSKIRQEGVVQDDTLIVTLLTDGERSDRSYLLESTIYPMSALYMIPLVQGLAVGRTFEYLVYNGETRSLDTIRQEILALEESELFEGRAYKVRTEIVTAACTVRKCWPGSTSMEWFSWKWPTTE